ncbi:MAG: alpha-amylase family glycosyl hydrolase [Armatimonadota bacterium]
MSKSLTIYNLFPRLYPNIHAWTDDLERIAGMGFNCIFLNPLHLPGYSGSLYSVYDYYRYNPTFFSHAEPEEELRQFLARCREMDIDVIMDLVANHTAIDSPLTLEHRDWYALEWHGEIMRPFCYDNGNKVVWEDLGKLDHLGTPDRRELWNYFLGVCRHALRLGFTGFRCDAAYQVPGEFWEFLITTLKAEFPHTHFLAESLGCPMEDTYALADRGFDYIFNSSMWWDLRDRWCLDAYTATCDRVSSVSFAETHDTARLMAAVGGHEPAFLQRLYFSAFFSKGFMAVSGMEYGFTRQPHVVHTTPADWEDTGRDYSGRIARALAIKRRLAPLHQEGPVEFAPLPSDRITGLLKSWQGKKALLMINTDAHHPAEMPPVDLKSLLGPGVLDLSPETRIPGYLDQWNIPLRSGEVKVFACEGDVEAA